MVAAPRRWRPRAATGTPVFPYLPRLFGAPPWPPPSSHAVGRPALAGDVGVRWLRLPWDAVFARSRLGGYAPYSPIFLLALPALLAGAPAPGRGRPPPLAPAGVTRGCPAGPPHAPGPPVGLPPRWPCGRARPAP